jgi:hypothetical protein
VGASRAGLRTGCGGRSTTGPCTGCARRSRRSAASPSSNEMPNVNELVQPPVLALERRRVDKSKAASADTWTVRSLSLSGRSFREEVTEFERWLRDHYAEQRLSWRRAAVLERPFGPDYEDERSHGTEIHDFDGFETRFREILASSAGGWVNLEAVTIRADTLIVALVWRPDDGTRTRPVSVNYSGLTRSELERLAGSDSSP